MATRSSVGRMAGVGRMAAAAAGVAVLVVAVVACGPAATPDGSPGIASGGGASPAILDATDGPSPSVAGRDAPPDALLAAEGGDPVIGHLGSYVWFETGSDSPWLPGSPMTVGTGEPLTLSLVPGGDIRAWAARYLPAAAAGPDGAMILAEGTGSPAFDAPGPGMWTVEVFVEFAAGVGDASYFWRLEVE
jgi:hypothetical protein